jgi:hypothetical protein
MLRYPTAILLGLLLMQGCAAAPRAAAGAVLAATPPMGWNSWDAYAETVTEADLKANADWMAKNLKASGWTYIVVDAGWYISNHTIGVINSTDSKFNLDDYGRYVPAVNTIPSAAGGQGFKPLADYVHSLGLKFGIHIMRGIPKEAVRRNLPIAGTAYHAADAADLTDECPWNPFNYGLNTHSPAAQAYYDSLAEQYRGWGVDYLKIDCIASHPYKGEEIRMISSALRKSGRPVVLSLSPGPAPLDKAAELSANAQMWRISDDVWDIWYGQTHFPQGPGNQFAPAAEWAKYSGPGHWPDADMLPIGRLEPAAGYLQPRASRLNHDEQRTLLTLWCMFRSPLIMGGNLTHIDEWTNAALTNGELLDVDQHARDAHAVIMTPDSAVWVSTPAPRAGAMPLGATRRSRYLALFNLQATPRTLHHAWQELGLSGARYSLRDLWEHRDLPAADAVEVALPPHGSVIYRVDPAR